MKFFLDRYLITKLFIIDESCGECSEAIYIFSTNIFSEGIEEYRNADEDDIENLEKLGPDYWEKDMIALMEAKLKERKFVIDQGIGKIWRPNRSDPRVISVNFSTLWKPYKKITRKTNINFKELMGKYELYSCEEKTIFGENINLPVYRKVVDDKTDAFLTKDKFGHTWQVI